jgi:osmotically-inducible protein OsmY
MKRSQTGRTRVGPRTSERPYRAACPLQQREQSNEEVSMVEERWRDDDRHPISSQLWGTPAQPRGPKNYQRSDERIYEDVCERLRRALHVDLREVIVEVKDGTVSLYGSVPHRQMKHWIEDLAADTPGVKDVENKLDVALVAGFP